MNRIVSRAAAFGALALFGMANAAHAQVTVNIFQSGPDVDAQATGKLNLTGLDFNGNGFSSDSVAGEYGGVIVGNNSANFDFYSNVTPESPFGSGGIINASSGSGDRFSIVALQNNVAVPTGYVSESPINGSAVFSNQTLSSLGLTPGTYIYTLPNDTVTVQIGAAPAAVPEPGSIALFIGMASVGAGVLRRKRRK